MAKNRVGGQEAAELLKTGDVVEKRWKVERVLGRGGFGAVYEVLDGQTGRHEAMKIELQQQDFRTLKLEVIVLKELNANRARHVCDIVGIGKREAYCYIVMTLVGPSFQSMLQALKPSPNGDTKFGIRSAVHLGIKSLEALEDMHKIGYIHRDIKPQNYSVGRAPEFRRVFMLDFGMSRKYLRADGSQRRAREKARFRGTLYYASVPALNGEDQSPRDDLWSWFFMLIRMTVGRVPWRDDLPPRNLPIGKQAQYYASVKQKLLAQPTIFLAGCPAEFVAMYYHLMSLTYESKRHKFAESTPLDWEVGGEHYGVICEAPAHNMMPDPTNRNTTAAAPSAR